MITFKELEEQLYEAHKVGDKVLIHKGPTDAKGKHGRIGEIRKGLYKGAPKTYTVDYDHHETTGERKSIQLKPTHFKAVKEDLDEAVTPKGHTIEAHGIKGTKGTPWRKTFKSHEHLHDWADKNDSVEVHGTRDLEHTKKTNEEVKLDEVRMTAAMKLQQAFQREQEKTARERKAGEDLLKKKEEPKKVNESTDHHAEAEEHLSKANDADAKGDKKSYHAHMANHHDAMSMWHDSKGRSASADKHAEKAEHHHELSLSTHEEVACNNVGGGSIAGTQGDAGKKSVITKKPMKRQTFKEFSEECDCWANYKRKPGTKPCAKGSCVKESVELEEGKTGLWANIHAKRKRIKNGSGEKMRAPGSKGAPTDADFKAANEELSVDEQFDLIEELVSELALENNVDAETVWESLESIEDDQLFEYAIDAKGHKSSTGGLTQKGVDAYNRKTGGNLKTAVTTPPSKLKPGSKAAKRRKSFCARMSGVDGPMKKPNGEPTRKALALRKWNC